VCVCVSVCVCVLSYEFLTGHVQVHACCLFMSFVDTSHSNCNVCRYGSRWRQVGGWERSRLKWPTTSQLHR